MSGVSFVTYLNAVHQGIQLNTELRVLADVMVQTSGARQVQVTGDNTLVLGGQVCADDADTELSHDGMDDKFARLLEFVEAIEKIARALPKRLQQRGSLFLSCPLVAPLTLCVLGAGREWARRALWGF
jgi:hypothetical protein